MLAVGAFVTLFAGLLALGAIAEDVHDQEAIALDALVTPLLHGLSNPTLDFSMRVLTDLGSTLVIGTVLLVTLMLLMWRRHRREALFLAVSLAGSLALNQSLKLIFHRPRPQLAWAHIQPDYSFPSGHAMNSLVLYVALALIVWALWGRRAGLLGYHYFTDVVGGFLAGAAWLLIVSAAFNAGPRLRRWRAEASGP